MDKANMPRTWLVTDERMGDRLFGALDRLPAKSGVLFRHHALARSERLTLGREVAATCRSAGHLLAVSRDEGLARELGARLVHNPERSAEDFRYSFAVHNAAAVERANQQGAALAFLSPIFPTRSHPGSSPLPRREVKLLIEKLDCPVIALGGMTAQNFAEVEELGFHGWAGIDAWL